MKDSKLATLYAETIRDTKATLEARKKCLDSICRSAKVGKRTVYWILSGKSKSPKIETLQALTDAARRFPTDVELRDGLER